MKELGYVTISMKRLIFISFLFLSVVEVKIEAQCVTVGSDVTICQGTTLTSLGGAMINGTKKVMWSDNGVGGTFSPGPTTLNASWKPPSAFSGTATLTLTATAGCSSSPDNASFRVTVSPLPVATFSYTTTPYCSTESNPFPTFSGGGSAGVFSSTKGLVFVSTSTGQVDLAASAAGTYTVTNTIAAAGGCSRVTATSTITITTSPAASIFYAGTPFCKSFTSAQPVTRTGTSGGRYSSVAGLTINATSGAITPGSSTAGTYTVTYTMAATGGCGAVTATTSVTITGIPVAPVVGNIIQPTCSSNKGSVDLSGLPALTNWIITASPGGATYPGNGTSTTISSLNSGTYTFIVTVPNNCSSSSSGRVVINPQPLTPSAPIVGTVTPSACSAATGSVQLSGLPSTGTWTLTRNPGGVKTTGSGISVLVSSLPSGTFKFTVTGSSGCVSQSSDDVVILTVPSSPSAPVIGTISQPTCAISTGSVVLSGLPADGTWTVTRYPDGASVTGTGIATTISALPAGNFSFTVTNSSGCMSIPSGNVLINTQPLTPGAPVVGIIAPPTCSLPTGSVVLTGLPSTGTWTLIRYPGTVITTGTGANITISDLLSGIYNYTVTSAEGCLSAPSANIVIPSNPATPGAPVIGAIIQPTKEVPTGSVTLNGLPSTGAWVITRYPDAVATEGFGTSKIISGLEVGEFTFTVTNSSGCTSTESTSVIITAPGIPLLVVSNPPAACFPSTVDLTNAAVTAGSSPGLTITYWTNGEATIPYNTPTAATAGTYYIRGSDAAGFSSIKPVIVIVNHPAVANGGSDQTLEYIFSTTLDAKLNTNETGIWSLVSGLGEFAEKTNPETIINDLSIGENILLWSVTDGVCPSVSDTVVIRVRDAVIPTLITPNMDGKNDCFVLKELENMGKTELTIFDRRGYRVYINPDYDNKWNGVDFNNRPLPEDTYFYVLRPQNGKSLTGYILIRR
jgi:gliding motility-associated-like protein